ncbi:hypothetical protein IMZ48_28145 [Candidatus Bathyarchaeota archaeon]|nr:hypothetical protein [Candidatus Bathyarchaeota archaeon]
MDIQVVKEKWPTNHWPKDPKYKQLGRSFHPRNQRGAPYPPRVLVANPENNNKGIWNHENALNGIAAISLAVFTRPTSEGGLGWSSEEVQVLLAGVRKDLKDTRIHAYWPM